MISLLAGFALAIAGVAGLFTYRSAAAQAPTPTAPEAASPAAPAGQPSFGGRHGGATETDLAGALGISVEDLQAAQETALKEALSQAVEKDLITQAQADAILNRGIAGRLPRAFGRWEESGIDYQALLADALGISVDALQAALQQAFVAGIDRAVAEGALTAEQADLLKGRQALWSNETFQNSMTSAFESAVAQAVEGGVITQAQADAILAQEGNFFRRGGFPMRGLDGPHGRRGGGRFLPETAPNIAPEGGL
jgi:hypothetical protein